MYAIEIRECDEGGTTVRSTKHENAVASLSIGRLRSGVLRCQLTVGGLTDELTGLDATARLDTADPQVVKLLMDHDWRNVEATLTVCWRLIFERMTVAQFRSFCVNITRAAWRQGRDDTRTVMARALGLETTGPLALTPTVVARVLGDG